MREELKTESQQYFRNSSEQLQSRVVTDAWRNRRGVPVCLCPARLGSHFTAVVSISGLLPIQIHHTCSLHWKIFHCTTLLTFLFRHSAHLKECLTVSSDFKTPENLNHTNNHWYFTKIYMYHTFLLILFEIIQPYLLFLYSESFVVFFCIFCCCVFCFVNLLLYKYQSVPGCRATKGEVCAGRSI